VKVKFTPRGDLRAQKANVWWRKNRPDTSELFADELARAVKDLETIPHLGTPRPTERRPLLKRLLLEKTKCHVYFEVDEQKEEIRILMIWGAPRGREPKL
jgi:plasmid stabilization system protein ParE